MDSRSNVNLSTEPTPNLELDAPLVAAFLAGIGVSDCGGLTLPAARETADFIRVASSAHEREGAHSVALDLEPADEQAPVPPMQ